MKLRTIQLGLTLAAALGASPVLAQTNDEVVVYQSAGVLAWILVGLIAGYLASRLINKTGEGLLRDILLGIIGGIVGGILFRSVGGQGVTGFNLGSIFVAFMGAIVVLLLYHAVTGRRTSM